MRKLVIGAAALVGLVASTSPASAQVHHRNVIVGSGHGGGNTVIAHNHVPPGPVFAGGCPGGPGGAQTVMPVGGSPGGPVGFPGGFPGVAPGGVVPFGGYGSNRIVNSGNGVGNTVIAQNGGVGFNGSYPGGGAFPGGVNINVVANSGNGVGNTVIAGNNAAPGGLNINVVANSGNGSGNTIVTRN